MFCICGFGFGQRKVKSQDSYHSPESSEELPRYKARAPLIDNWLQHLLDSIQEHSFHRRKVQVRGLGHAAPFVYSSIPSDDGRLPDEETQLPVMSEKGVVSIG